MVVGPHGEVRNAAPDLPCCSEPALLPPPRPSFIFCSISPGSLLSGRKLKLREGKGLPGVTQQAGGRGTCDPSLGVGGPLQLGLSGGSRLPAGHTHTTLGAVDKQPLQAPPPENIPLVVHFSTRQGSLGPQPLVPAWLETACPAGWGPSHLLVIGFQGCLWLC